jgi:late competence protein required for DNA uptake (superfamily II DNA/RNA helicase)
LEDWNHNAMLEGSLDTLSTPKYYFYIFFLKQYHFLYNKKGRGIGVTELILRYLAWSCLSSDRLEGMSIFLVSGTREDFSNNIKIRLEKLFERNFPNVKFISKYTELTIGKTWIKVFPTKRIQDLRGYTDVSYLFKDEADYFDPAEQFELEYVIKAYEEKSKCKIILASTPNKPL